MTEIEKLKAELRASEDRLAYEQTKHEKLMANRESGIASQISDGISLELAGLRDIAEYLPEDDKRRVLRRVNRIIQFLDEFQN